MRRSIAARWVRVTVRLVAPALLASACAATPDVDWRGLRGWPAGGPAGAATPGLAGALPQPGRIAQRHAPLECVPFARELSGVDLVGDAWTWWDQAAGRFARDRLPRIGAVMAFRATTDMPLGHVATVSRLLGPRELLITHANWDGGIGKGQVDVDQRVRDVSVRGDWSLVRVWHPGQNDWGSGVHPVAGFILAPVDRSPVRLALDVPAAHQRAIAEAERLARLERGAVTERGGGAGAAPQERQAGRPAGG